VSASLAQPCRVSRLDELVSPIRIFTFTPCRRISLSTPQVVKGCDAIARMTGDAALISRTCWAKLVSSKSHLASPLTSSPALGAASFITAYQVARLWAKFSSTPAKTVLSSGLVCLTQRNRELYISDSLGTLRKAHSEILASPPLIATSVKIGNCKPESVVSPAFFCSTPNRGSATFEQVGPTAISVGPAAMRRTTEMPSSAVQRSSRNSTSILPVAPSASL